jgi:glycosyltransferase involved in cell wall biosynthesis
LEEVRWLRARGHLAWIACDPRSEMMKRAGAELCVPVEMTRAVDWRASLELRRFCREQGIDVIHTHSSKDSWVCYPLHVAAWPVVRSRQITNLVSPTIDRSFIYRHGCAAVIASAASIRENLISHTRVAAERVRVVGEGVELERFSPSVSGERVRAQWGVQGDDVLFGLVAMIRPEKGHLFFIEAAEAVLKTPGVKVRFAIVGEGTGNREFEQMVRAQLVMRFGTASDGPVFMTGYRQDVPEVMAALDVLVVPSTAEAQSIVTPQAFASGKPVIASRVGGLPEIIRDGETGLLVPPGDVATLAAEMRRLANNEELRKTMGVKAREYAVAELSFGAKMEECLALYTQLTRSRRKRRMRQVRATQGAASARPATRRRWARERVAGLVSLSVAALVLMIFAGRPSLDQSPVQSTTLVEPVALPVTSDVVYDVDMDDETNADETASDAFSTTDERIIG